MNKKKMKWFVESYTPAVVVLATYVVSTAAAGYAAARMFRVPKGGAIVVGAFAPVAVVLAAGAATGMDPYD